MTALLPRRITAVIYGVATLFLAAIVGAALVMTWQMRDSAIADSESQAVRFVSGSEAVLNRSLLGVDLLLASLGDLLRHSTATTLAADAAKPQMAQLMGSLTRQNLLVQYVAFVTPQGIVGSSDRRGAQLPLQLPDGFLDQVLSQAASTLLVSRPFSSAVTSQRVVHFARRFQLADHSHVVAIAEVQLSLLTTILTQGADIRGLEVTLELSGGPLLASVPPRDDLAGRVIAPALHEMGSDGLPSLSPARLSGQPAIVVARPTLHRNLLIVASIPLRAALHEWSRQRAVILAAGTTFMLMILSVSYLTHMHMRRQWRSKRTLDQALESMADGFVLLDADHRILSWNRRFIDMFPWSQGVIAPLVPFHRITEQGTPFIASDSGPGGLAPVDREDPVKSPVAPVAGAKELVLAGGQVILAVKSRTPDGGLVCVYHDITEKRRFIADIVDNKAQLQATLDALPDALLEMGLDGRCRRFHPPRKANSLIDEGIDPVGRSISELLPTAATTEINAAIQETYVSGFSVGRQFERRATQGTHWFEISVSRKAVGEGVDACFIVILRDITERKSAAREIEALAFYDGLTGLPNRPLLMHKLKAAIDNNQRGARHGALLFLDLDHFKRLNDAHGHTVGNHLLKQVAIRLLASMREGDTVARLSGDEFVVLLENLSQDAAIAEMQTRALAESILAELHRPFELVNQAYHSTCSIGATMFGGQALSLEDLLKQADIAMYYVKTSGGNALRFFEAAMQTTITARANLESELHAAMAAKEFVLHYQRQVTSEGQVVGAEVLIRWRHPRRGMVPPAGFIELAESTGLIVPMGIWVLEQACLQLERWSHHPKRSDLKLAVNVSARQFRSDDFADQVREVLIRTGANPKRLKLELTESLLQDQVSETIRKMKSLAAIGIQFSMDDFGTGFSSLSYMTQLPLHQVKIDKFFVQSIGVDPKVEMIIQTIIGMAQSLDLSVIAEGVETPEQVAFLERNGCLLCQGYHFGKPLPFDEFDHGLDAELVT